MLKSKKQSDKDMDKAVGEYLKQVGSSGTSVATALDKNFSDVINTAKDAVKNAPKDKKSKADKLQKALVSIRRSSHMDWTKICVGCLQVFLDRDRHVVERTQGVLR